MSCPPGYNIRLGYCCVAGRLVSCLSLGVHVVWVHALQGLPSPNEDAVKDMPASHITGLDGLINAG